MGGPLKPFLEDEETFQIIGAAITPQAHCQAINYVKAAKQERGLLINFAATSLQHKRCT